MLILKLIGFIVCVAVVFFVGNRIGHNKGYGEGHGDGRNSFKEEIVRNFQKEELQIPSTDYFFAIKGEWVAVVHNTELEWEIIAFQSDPQKVKLTQRGLLLGDMSLIP